jgi:hypothetical protein
MKKPIQPIENHRFVGNKIVEYLLEHGRETGCDLNTLARIDFPQEDREQFAQLISYSLSGYGELSYVSDDSYDTASLMSETGETEEQCKIRVLEEKLNLTRDMVRGLATNLFNIHPDDLKE